MSLDAVIMTNMSCSLLGLGLLVSVLDDLLLEDGGLGEAERDLVGGESVVAVDDGIELLVHDLIIERVEEHDLLSSAIGLNAHGSLLDAGGEQDVVEDLLVDGHEAARSGSHLTRVVLGRGRDDVSVGDDDGLLAELGLELLLDDSTDLLEGAERTVGNAHKEVLIGGTVALSVVNVLGRVQEDDLQVGVEIFELGAEGVEVLGDFLLEVSGLLTVLLNDSISFTEHVCFLVSQIGCLFVC
jgi:hypothetical protein